MSYITINPAEAKLAQTNFITKVYAWMCMALMITAVTAAGIASVPGLAESLRGNTILSVVLIIAQLGLVFAIVGAINRMSAMTATLLFMLYSLAVGVMLSGIFLVYKLPSIGTTFMVTAGTFGIMSVYGYTTKRDLTSMGNLFIQVLIGIIIASVVNMFLHSSALEWILTFAGIIVFVGLTAYDTQKIKEMAASDFQTSENMRKGAIIGALTLYLDFVNLFLLLLQLFGDRRRD